MADQLLCVIATDANLIPSRVCGVLEQRQVDINSIHMTRQPGDGSWRIEILIDVVRDGQLELIIKQLNRLIEVRTVVRIEDSSSEQRQSVFVTLTPAGVDLASVAEVVRLFGAETVDLESPTMVVHLSATPERCQKFLAFLAPYSVANVALGPVAAVRRATRSTRRRQTGPDLASQPSLRRGRPLASVIGHP